MQFTNRQLHFAAQAAIVLAFGVFLAMAGPFGTYGDLAPGPRYAYWIGLCLFGFACLVVVAHALRRLSGWRAIGLAALASAVPTTFAVTWAEQLLRLDHAVPLHVLPRVFGSVAAIQLLMLLLLARMRLSLGPLLWHANPASESVPQSETMELPFVPEPALPPKSAAAHAGFLARIPPHLGNELLALQAEDHYLRVVTPQGSDLILMRLADALRELPPASGMQVHRSWWVAFDAVTAMDREPGKLTLRLKNDAQVPVSRTYAAAVKTANWPLVRMADML